MHFSLDQYWSTKKQEQLKKLVACEHLTLISKHGGGNSVVYCVAADKRKYAIKLYPPYAAAQRDRLAAEVMVYQFFNQHSVPTVPLLKAYCETERWLVIEWIDGKFLVNYSPDDIAQAISFIHTTSKLSQLNEARVLPEAAEACLSLDILLEQIQQRLQRLLAQSKQEKYLENFLINDFMPVFEKCQQQAIKGYRATGIDSSTILPIEQRALIPADFGFHNMIRDQLSRMHFFDFDYFGWDDPVKLLADILWHPKMQLSEAQKKQFIDGLSAIYRSDPLFLLRFHYNRSLFGLRWVLIMLNEFIPAFWQNRQHANVFSNQTEAKTVQLQRARIQLLNVQEQSGCSYDFTN